MSDETLWTIDDALIGQDQPTRIFLIGPSGSGKSAVGRLVAERVPAALYDTDSMIRAETGCTIDQIFSMHGEAYFRDLEKQCIDRIQRDSGLAVVATGGGLPAIPGMMEHLNSIGTTIYLRASPARLWRRLRMDKEGFQHRPLLKEGGQAALEELIDRRAEVYQAAAIILDTERLTPDRVCVMLVDYLDGFDESS
jgi:shikimate kinase